MTSNPSVTHAVNTGVVAITASSWWANAPQTVTVTLGLLGIVWYVIQIVEWVSKKIIAYTQIEQSSRRVVAVIKAGDANHVDDPSPP